MMRYIFLLLSLFSIDSIFGQVTFNRRYDLGADAANFRSIYVTDSMYYVTGIILPDANNYFVAPLFTRIDLEGDVVDYTISGNEIKKNESWENTLIYNNQGFYNVAYQFTDTCMAALVLDYDIYGDTNKTIPIYNPIDSCNFIKPTGLLLDSQGDFLIASELGITAAIADPHLAKIDQNDSVLWEFVPEFPGYKSYTPKILEYQDQGHYLFGHRKSNAQFTQSLFIIRHQWHKLDVDGDEILRKETPGAWELLPLKLGRINDIQWAKDGGLIVASAWGWEYQGTSHNFMRYHPFVYKLDSNLNWIWGTKLEGDIDYPDSEATEIIEQSDTSLIIVRHAPYNNSNLNQYHSYGFITKLNSQGDSLWSKKYYYPLGAYNHNYFYSTEQTHDGGYIMCGYTQGNDPNNPNAAIQQGWLLKVDSFGCLVPGCHLMSSQEEIETKTWRMDIYPNPTTDFINVYLGTGTPANATLSVINLQGQVMEETHVHADATYIFSVVDYSVGVYFLRLVSPEGALLGTKKVIVGR